MCVCVCVYWWERLHPSFINWILFGRLGKEEHAIDWFIHSFPHTSHLHTHALKHTHKHATLEGRYYWIETLWHPLSHRPAQCSAKLSLPLSVIICMCGQSKTHKGNKIFSVYSPETRIDGRKYRKWHLCSDMFFFLFLVVVSEMCTNGERNTTEKCYCFEERFTLYLCFRYLIMQ